MRRLTVCLCLLTCTSSAFAAQEKSPPRIGGKTLAEWEKLLQSKDAKEQQQAIECLGFLGPVAKEAVPALCPFLKSKDELLRQQAMWAVEQIGDAKAAIPVLREQLRSASTTAGDKGNIVSVLGYIDASEETAKILAPFLRYRSQPVDEQDWIVRNNAACSIGRIGSKAKLAIPELRQALQDESRIVRTHAARALWLINQEKEAVTVLIDLLREGKEEACVLVLNALGDIGPPAKEAVPVLLRMISEKPPNHLCRSCLALWRIDRHPVALATLLELLDDPAWKSWACRCLEQVGADAKAATPRLLKMLGSENDAEGLDAARALWAIEKHPRALETIVHALDDEDPRNMAVFVLQEMGEDARPALPQLITHFKKQKQDNVRYRLARIIVLLDPQAAEQMGIR